MRNMTWERRQTSEVSLVTLNVQSSVQADIVRHCVHKSRELMDEPPQMLIDDPFVQVAESLELGHRHYNFAIAEHGDIIVLTLTRRRFVELELRVRAVVDLRGPGQSAGCWKRSDRDHRAAR